jgi:hypothetical protein
MLNDLARQAQSMDYFLIFFNLELKVKYFQNSQIRTHLKNYLKSYSVNEELMNV